MISTIWWHLTRSSANVAWGLAFLSILWGVLLTTRILRGTDSPAWLRDLHSWLGGLTVVFTGIHMATLVADSYVEFSALSTVVPFTAEYRPWPVAFGILAWWLLVAVQGTSLMMRHLPRALWRRIHQLSWVMWAATAVHALTAGSDVGTPLYTGFTMAVVMTGTAVGGIRWVAGRSAARRALARGAATAE